MAKIIEFIGLPGVGKTTTFKHLSNYWNSSNYWTPYQKCEFPKYKPQLSLRSKIKNLMLLKVQKEIIIPNFTSLYQEKFIKDNQYFMDCLWYATAGLKVNKLGKDHRLKSFDFILTLIAKNQFIKEYNKAEYCIIDEGLLHNISLVTSENENLDKFKEQVEEILEKTKLVDVVFYFKTDVDIIVKRLINRNSIPFPYEGMDESQLKNLFLSSIQKKDICCELLDKYKIPYFEIDAEMNPAENAKNIIGILNSLA